MNTEKSKKNLIKSINTLVLLASFFALFSLSACFALPVEEPALPPPVIQTFRPDFHETMTANRGNLQRYRNLSVRIVPAREELLTFDVPGVHIQAIHVEVGDEVLAGDIVAELDRDDFVRTLYLAERGVAASNIGITHLDQRQRLSEQEAATRGDHIDGSWYIDERGALQTDLAIWQLTTGHLEAASERRLLRATMDGTVTHVMAFRDGDISTLESRVVTIADETRSIFSVSGRETAYLIPGDVHIVTVNREPFEAVVIDPQEWGLSVGDDDDLAFLTVYADDVYVFPERAIASLHLVLEEVQNVIAVPIDSVHNVDGQEFVFVMENGLRTIRNVITGMEGNVAVEILSGLEEGDLVVIG